MRFKLLAAGAVLGATALVLAGCSGGGGGTPSSSSSAGPTKELQIGFITPLTGPSASTGLDAQAGAEAVVAEWNKEHLLPGYSIKLDIEDDGGTPETGVLAYQKLHDQGVKIFAGTMNSSVAIAVANAVSADPDALYFISGAQTQVPLDAQSGNMMFALQTTNQVFADANLNYIKDTAKPKKVALLVENSDFGVAEKQQVEAHWASGSPKIVLEETFDRSLTDFSSILAKVRDSGADAVYVGAAGVTFPAAIFTQADSLGLKVKKFMNAGLMGQALIDAGGQAIDGITSADSYISTADTAMNKKFVKEYKAANSGKEPGGTVSFGYDSVGLILQAIKQVKSADDTHAIADALRSGTWQMTTGKVTFDDTGRVVRGNFIISVKNGKLTLVKKTPAPTPTPTQAPSPSPTN
ncbi:MAG TPA: ABC transporter substrate-binding protein [Pseudolysinimonas sp.]|jgi:branched-chain amino acid transport system substrate-binding protein